MKKRILFIFMLLGMISYQDVEACGRITDFTTSVGTVVKVGETSYQVMIPEGTTQVTLEPTTDSTWVEDFGPRTVRTDEGEVQLIVDGNVCGLGLTTYFVEFKNLDPTIAENDEPTQPEPTEPTTPTEPNPNPDATPGEPDTQVSYGVLTLNNLIISNADFTFEPDKRVYDLEVEGTIGKLDIDAISNDNQVTITIGGDTDNLKEGMNTITISLADPYGNTGLYVLNVNKVKAKSSNNYLASLTIDKYQLNFDPSITAYTLEIGKESMLNITAITESELASYEILGNASLGDGSKVTIKVTAENGTTREYVITTKRSFNIMDYWIFIVIALLVILLILLLLISKKKKNKKKMDGPSSIEGQTETAGVIAEVASQNQNTAQPATTAEGGNTQTSVTPGTLHIIEPTNIEEPAATPSEPTTNQAATTTGTTSTTPETQAPAADSQDDSPTEVFQL